VNPTLQISDFGLQFFQEVAKECNISCMPTFQFFKNGKKVAEFSGADESKLEKMITDNK
jgi:thioredoxin 1